MLWRLFWPTARLLLALAAWSALGALCLAAATLSSEVAPGPEVLVHYAWRRWLRSPTPAPPEDGRWLGASRRMSV